MASPLQALVRPIVADNDDSCLRVEQDRTASSAQFLHQRRPKPFPQEHKHEQLNQQQDPMKPIKASLDVQLCHADNG